MQFQSVAQPKNVDQWRRNDLQDNSEPLHSTGIAQMPSAFLPFLS